MFTKNLMKSSIFFLSLFLTILFLFQVYLSSAIARVVKAEGEACHSDLRKAKELALKDAKKNAVETYLGVLIESKQLLVNGKLKRKTIQSIALGKIKLIGSPIYEETFKDIEKDLQCVKVHAQFQLIEEEIKQADFGLKIILNKNEFLPGEELRITLYSKTKCYPYLFSVDTLGNVYRLLPNRIESSPVIKGKLEFPTFKMRKEGISLIVYPIPNLKKVQEEEILFLCLKKPDDALRDLFPEAFAEDITDVAQKLKRIKEDESIMRKAEHLAKVLNQIGLHNYEMVDTFYLIRVKDFFNKAVGGNR